MSKVNEQALRGEPQIQQSCHKALRGKWYIVGVDLFLVVDHNKELDIKLYCCIINLFIMQ